jgi:predicted amidohydrolase YtcJ
METAIFSTRIFTGDMARPWAEAMCVKDDQVAAVGNNEEIKKACTRQAQVIELPGRLVAPGIVDAHLHFVSFGLYLRRLDLRDLPSIEDCRLRVKGAVKTRRPGEWIIGRGWNEHVWKDRREPTARDLDDIAPIIR